MEERNPQVTKAALDLMSEKLVVRIESGTMALTDLSCSKADWLVIDDGER